MLGEADFRNGEFSLVGENTTPASHPSGSSRVVSQSVKIVFGLLAVVLLVGSGCCAFTPEQCGYGLSEYDLGCALDRLCTGDSPMSCGLPHEIDYTLDSTYCEECQPAGVLGYQQLADLHLKRKWHLGENVQPGPPPVSYRPPMPPEFLPVPTRPIFAAVNLAAPESAR